MKRWWLTWWKQFGIASTVSVVGMTISHWIPTYLFWFWIPTSLLIGHLINRVNYKI